MDRRDFARIGLGLAAGGAALAAGSRGAGAAEGEAAKEKATKDEATKGDAGKGGTMHRVAIQVSSEDHRTQELALGNAHNYAAYYKAKNEPFQIELVAFGPGYAMFRDDMSMVKGNIETLKGELGEHITFAACQNTRAAIAASMGKQPDAVPQMKDATSVPSGIVRLCQLQEQGWAYIRP